MYLAELNQRDGVPWFRFFVEGRAYGIYANIWGILMVNVTIYSIHGSYGEFQSVQKVQIVKKTSGSNSMSVLTWFQMLELFLQKVMKRELKFANPMLEIEV